MAKLVLDVVLNTSKFDKKIEELVSQLDELIKKETELNNTNENIKKSYDRLNQTVASTTKQLQQLNSAYNKANNSSKKQSESESKLKNIIDKATGAIEKKIDAETASSKVVEEGSAAIEKNTSVLGNNIAKVFEWMVATTLVMAPLRLLQNAWSSVNKTLVETENRVIAIKRVLPKGSASNDEISDKLYDLAQQYGQTFDNVSDIATNFARTGMSWQETIQATEAALLALNVAELDASEASDGLIAIMTQFKIEASDLTGVIDMLNKTADNYAVTSEKLLVALQRTGSSAANANLSLEETIGLIAALSEATGRSGENLGTAVNSLIQYSSKASSLDVFAKLSQNTADAVSQYRMGAATILDVWQAVSGEIQNLNERQTELLKGLTDSDEMKNLESELHDELGDIFEEIGDVYGTANTFRKNYFIALLGNMDTVLSAIKTAQNSAGYSAKENEEYLKSYEAKLTTLKAQWQDIANDAQGVLGLKKGLVDIASALLVTIEYTGGLRTILIGVGSAMMYAFGPKIISGIGSFISNTKNLVLTLNGAETAAIGFGTAISTAFGWIGIIGSVLSAVVGIVQKSNQAQHEANLKAIEAWENDQKRAVSLKALKLRYDELEPKNEEFYKIESQIVELLGEKKKALEGLTKGTEEYTKAVEAMTQTELAKYQIERENALKAAEDELVKQKTAVSVQEIFNEYGEIVSASYSEIFDKAGIKYSLGDIRYGVGGNYRFLDFGLSDEETPEAKIKNLEILEKDFVSLMEYRNTLIRNGASDEEAAEILDIANMFYNEYEKLYPLVERYQKYNDIQKDIQKAYDELTTSSNKNNDSLYTKEQRLADLQERWEKLLKTIEETTKFEDMQNQLIETRAALEKAQAEARIKGIVSAMNAEKNGQKDALDLEEKRLVVEKAREALRKAQETRNVRVYNAESGIFEWRSNEKDIQSAEKSLDSAIKSLNEYIENQAWDEVISALQSGTSTDEEILAIVEKWSSMGLGSPEWAAKIIEAYNNSKSYIPGEDEYSSATDRYNSAVEKLRDFYIEEAKTQIEKKLEENPDSISSLDEVMKSIYESIDDEAVRSEVEKWWMEEARPDMLELFMEIYKKEGKYFESENPLGPSKWAGEKTNTQSENTEKSRLSELFAIFKNPLTASTSLAAAIAKAGYLSSSSEHTNTVSDAVVPNTNNTSSTSNNDNRSYSINGMSIGGKMGEEISQFMNRVVRLWGIME